MGFDQFFKQRFTHADGSGNSQLRTSNGHMRIRTAKLGDQPPDAFRKDPIESWIRTFDANELSEEISCAGHATAEHDGRGFELLPSDEVGRTSVLRDDIEILGVSDDVSESKTPHVS